VTKHFNKTTEKEKRRKLRQNQTQAEELVWKFLRNRQMLGYKFKRQYSVDQYVIDFYCSEIKLAVELDGASHNSPTRKEYDIKRQKKIEAYGIKFERISDDELFGNPNKAFEKIEKAIKNLTPTHLPAKAGQALVKERSI